MSRVLSYAIQLKDEATETQDKMADGLEKINGNFLGIPGSALAAGAAIAGVSAAVVALGKTLFDLGDEMDAAFDKIRVGTGQTGESLEVLKSVTRGVVSDIPTDLDKASTAVTGFAQRLGLTGEPLRELAGDILELSRLTGSDLNENIRSSSALMRSWSVDQEDQRETLNQLLRAYQATGVSVTDLGRNVNDMGPIFRQMGLSLSESIALTAGLEREGVQAEAVVRGMNTAIAKLAEAGIAADDALPDLLATIRDMDSATEATSLSVELFGQRAGPRLAEAIRAGRLEIGELLDTIEDGDETIPQLAADTEDAAELMVKAWGEAKDAAAPFAEVVFNLATTIAKEVRPRIIEFREDLDAIRRLFEVSSAAAQRWAAQLVDAAGNVARAMVNATPAGALARAGGVNLADTLGLSLSDIAKTVADASNSAGNYVSDKFGDAAELLVRNMIEAGKDGIADAAADGADELLDAAEEGVAKATRSSRLSRGSALDAAGLLSLGLGKKDDIKTEAQQVAESAIDGFMAAMSANRANLQDQFGDFGSAAASALTTAIIDNTKSGGAAAFREVENIVLRLQKDGVPEWREIGDDLAGVFHTALISRLDSDKEAAFAKLQEIRELLRQRNALSPENLMESLGLALNAQTLGSGAGIMDSLGKAIEEGGEQNRKVLAQQAASWIGEVQRGLGPDRAAVVIDQFTTALTAAIEDRSPEASDALEDIFRNARFEIPQAALQKTLDDTFAQITKSRDEAVNNAFENFAISRATDFRRQMLRDDQDARMKALVGSFPDDQAKRAEDVAKRIADVQQKGQEAINDAHSRGDTLATLRAMKAAEDRVKEIRAQSSEQESQFNERKGREEQIAALREEFARENDRLSRQLQDEAFTRQIDQIGAKAAADRVAAQTRYDEGIANLNQQLGLVDLIGQHADHMWDGSLAGLQAVVAEARTLADALGITAPAGLGSVTTAAGTELDAAGNLRSLTPRNVTLNNYNYGFQGEDVVDEMMSDLLDNADSMAAAGG